MCRIKTLLPTLTDFSVRLKFDGEALETGVEHPFGNDVPDAAGDDVEQAFADEVLADDEGNLTDGDACRAVGGRDAA